MLTNSNLASQTIDGPKNLPIFHTDTFLSFLPLCHVFERTATAYTGFSCGATIAFAENIDKVSENMLEVKPTVIPTVPRLFERIHSKVMKTINNGSPAKQKIFYWALEIGKKYAFAKKSGYIPLGLRSKHRLAEKLVFSTLRDKTGGNLRCFVSGGRRFAERIR